jgi:hypothetical protein
MEISRNGIAYIALVIVLIAIWFLVGVLHVFNRTTPPTNSITVTTTTVPKTTAPTSTVVSSVTTTISANYTPSCSGFEISNLSFSANVTKECMWPGGELGLWSATGNAGRNHILVKGTNGTVYFNGSTFYNCTTFIQDVNLPPQKLYVNLVTGSSESGSCGASIVLFNTSLKAPLIVYHNVYNGAFSTGEYTGWNASMPGFGTGPLNMSLANKRQCFLSSPWNLSSYVGYFVATTFNCGLTDSPGNLTSDYFNASEPFLNFKIISADNSGLYVEVLYNNTQYITANYDTFNNTAYGVNATTTFRNASIPLVYFIGKPVRVRIVADTLRRQTYIAVGDFGISNTPPAHSIKPVALNISHA